MNRDRAEIPIFTDAGCVALGELIRRDRMARFGTLEKLDNRLKRLGLKTSETTLQRLEKPQPGKRPDWEVLNAIAYLGFVVNPQARRPFTTEELILIACEWIGVDGQILRGATMTNPDNEFIRMLRSQFPTPYDLAQVSRLTPEEAIEIYAGKNPNNVELGFLVNVLVRDDNRKWQFEELAEFCDRIYEPQLAEENPPAPEEQEDHHQVGNGYS
jgi:hypothetical protein